MATYKSWRKKYGKTMHSSAWTIISHGLNLSYGSVGGIETASNCGMGVDTDLEKYLSPELVLSGFMDIYVKYAPADKYLHFGDDIVERRYKQWSSGSGNRDLPEQALRDLVQALKENEFDADEFFSTLFNGYSDADTEEVSVEKDGSEDQKPGHLSENRKEFSEWFRLFYTPQAAAVKDGNTYFVAKLKESLRECEENSDILYADKLLNLAYDALQRKNTNLSEQESDRNAFLGNVQDFSEMASKYGKFQNKLLKRIVNQDVAVRRFAQGLFGGKIGNDEKKDGPESSFLFVGPPGVGKTYLAQCAAELSHRPYRVFYMSEYANQDSFCGLVGFEPTWKNAQEGTLTRYVADHPDAILVFDEIEKAHLRTKHLFLSILEGGKLKDLYTDEEVDFSKTVIIFTTNAGREFFEDRRDMSLSMLSEETLVDALKKDLDEYGVPKMPPEILSRLRKGHIIGFDHMDPVKLLPLIRDGLNRGAETIREKFGFECRYDNSLLPYIFLYSMGESLDARVATYRSESFIKDAVLKMMERIGEMPKDYLVSDDGGYPKIVLNIDVQKDKLVDELISMKDKPEVLIICSKSDSSKFVKEDKRYQAHFLYTDSFRAGYMEKIYSLLKKHKIAAVLVDPFSNELKTSDTGRLEGLSNKETRGLEIMSRIVSIENHPDVYCMELGREHIDYVDRQVFSEKGIKGVLEIGGDMNPEERSESVYSLCYELFLAKKLDSLARKGKRLNFEIGHRFEEMESDSKLLLSLFGFKLERNMDSEAHDIFIDDSPENRESFSDVVGGESAKEELRRYMNFLKDPEAYVKSGQQVSKGILLYGPPGTGKTKLARALACEAGCPFISATGTQFIHGDKKISGIFRLARKYAPSIIFIDEIESFAMDPKVSGQYQELVKELMTEMDGFNKSKDAVFVIAATNAGTAPDLGETNIYLDEALLRRFTKKVYMKWPKREERIEFVRKEQESLKDKQFNLNALSLEDIKDFADVSAGRSLAEIKNVIELAVGRAAENGTEVTLDMMIICFEETVYGEEHKYSKEHIRATAIHEAGHAFMGFYCDGFKTGRFAPEYATIIARGGYLGLVRHKDDETRTGYSKDELLKLVRIKLAGRAAEMVFDIENNGGLTTGASNDLESATNIVSNILCRYGMEEGFIASLPMSVMLNSQLAEKYYMKLNEILLKEQEYAKEIIVEHKDKVLKLADELMDKSRLDTREMADILEAEIVEAGMESEVGKF